MSGKFETALSQLGIELPEAPAPAANYVPYRQSGKTIYVSGQISADKDGLIVGKLGAELDIEAGQKAARACAIALLAQLKAACGGDLDRLKKVLKLTGFVNSTPDFIHQPEVINGASDFLGQILGPAGHHSRAAVSVASLPRGVAVEIDGIFEIE